MRSLKAHIKSKKYKKEVNVAVQESTSAAEYNGGIAPRKLRQITDYIHDHIAEEITLSSVAAEVGMNQYHMARAFKQATGVAPHSYVIKERIGRAKQLLAETQLPIIEICFRSGFNNQSHFTKLFHRLVGLTPNAYRES